MKQIKMCLLFPCLVGCSIRRYAYARNSIASIYFFPSPTTQTNRPDDEAHIPMRLEGAAMMRKSVMIEMKMVAAINTLLPYS
jgi:hypothetical protein